MQQLLGDRASTTDSTFLRELFLQRLPSNVRMVLASASATATLEELAELADKVVEVRAPQPQALPQAPKSPRKSSNYGRKCRNCRPPSDSSLVSHADVPNLEIDTTAQPHKSKQLAGTTKGMGARQRSAPHPATTPRRQTSRPTASGDRRGWP